MADFCYSVATGRFYREAPFAFIETGYSGAPGYINDPAAIRIVRHGPLPFGLYRILPPQRHPRLGPVALGLEMVEGNAFGRSGFFIHGDNAKGDRSASEGCIVLSRNARELVAAAVAKGADRLLVV